MQFDEKLVDLYKKSYFDNKNIGFLPITFFRRFYDFKINLLRFDHEITEVKPVFDIKKNINLINVFYNKKKPIYVSIGYTHDSSDGEFKKNLYSYEFICEYIKKTPNISKLAKEFYKKNKSRLKTSIKNDVLINILGAALTCAKVELNTDFLKMSQIVIDYWNFFNVKEVQPEYYFRGFFSPGNENSDYSVVGTKIIPLYFDNIKNIGVSSQNHHKEIIIYEILEKYILEGICPFVPIIWDYFIVDVSSIAIFSNIATYKKYISSEENVSYIKKLYKANEIPVNNLVVVETLKDLIAVPINFAEKKILLSNKCMIIFTEFVGQTFEWYRTLQITEEYEFIYKKVYENIYRFRAIFANIFYTLHVLHKRCKIIHGDLHLNNLTINFYTRNISVYYKVGGKEYLINTPANVYIIDFGRSIYHQDILIERKETENISENSKLLLSYFRKILPEFCEQNKALINSHIFKNFDKLFKLVAVCDFIYVLRCYKFSFIERASNEIIETCSEMIVYAEKYIRFWLPKLDESDLPEFGELIFEEFFISETPFDDVFGGYYDADKIIVKQNSFLDKVLGKEGYRIFQKKKNKNFNSLRKDFLKDYDEFIRS